jgi:hypothetical protein
MSVVVNVAPRLTDYSEITLDPTGFTQPGSIDVAYNKTTRKITLTGTVAALWRGNPVAELISGWESAAHNDTGGTWFLYYNGTAFIWSNDVWLFSDLQIAFVEYGANVNHRFGLKETHGCGEPWTTHMEFHVTLGTYRSAGGDVSGYTINSTTAAERRPLVSSCTINDEDVPSTLPALSTELYTQFYLSGAQTANYAVDAADIVPVLAARPYYNQWNGSAWVQTLMPNNAYAAVWLLAVPASSDADSQKFRYLWIQPQSQSTTLTTIRALQTTDVNLGELNDAIPEFVFIQKTIIRYTNSNWVWTETNPLTGTRRMHVASVAGFFLSAVEHDATLTGEGTVGSPLALSGLDTNGVTIANRNDSLLDSLYFG